MIRGATMGIAAFVLCAAAARGDVAMAWSRATGTIVVAHEGKIEGFDRSGETRLWSAKGLASPSSIVLSPDEKSAVILDGFSDRVAIVSVVDGTVRTYQTSGTPVAAAFFERDVWVVLRDRSSVLRITPEGTETRVGVALDPALITASDRYVYVYSRSDGLLQEIDSKAVEVTRTVAVGAGGSDLELRPLRPDVRPGAVAYLCRPGSGSIVAIDLVLMKTQEIGTGGAPIDLAFVPRGAELSIDPGTAVFADPGRQAVLASKDLGPAGVMTQPAAVDRIMITQAGLFAFDSNSGTLYRLEGRKSTRIESGLTATSFVPTDESLFTWDAKSGKPRRAIIE